MSDFSYRWTARLLLDLGFTNLAEVEARFEAALLASMGEAFILAHSWALGPSADGWYAKYLLQRLDKLKAAGVPIGSYRPAHYPESVVSGVCHELRQMSADRPVALVPDSNLGLFIR